MNVTPQNRTYLSRGSMSQRAVTVSISIFPILPAALLIFLGTSFVHAETRAPYTVDIKIDWQQIIGEAKTTLTIEVCAEPPMRRGGPIHAQAHTLLRDLNMSNARLALWSPYPRLSIPALEPPGNGKTSWDFTLIDPIVLDFYEAAQGRPIVLNMAIPRWLFDAPPHHYPYDPNVIDWAYEFGPDVGFKFRDPTFRDTAAYFRRIAEWYIRGGFIDEYGVEHRSGHRLKVDYWEVLNEQDEEMAHRIDPQTYTAAYDEVVAALQTVDSAMKFSALALSDASNLHYIEYFLNPKNHRPGIPLDMISYHKYIVASANGTPRDWQHEMFTDTDQFLLLVEKIERIRRRLSPNTKTFISEFGVMLERELKNTLAPLNGGVTDFRDPVIPERYWTLAASVLAYGYLGAVRSGVDMLAAAELVNYPGQFSGTNLIHWKTGKPNAVYRVLKLLHEQLPSGSKLMKTTISANETIEAQGFVTERGKKILLINKTSITQRVAIASTSGSVASIVDATTGSAPPLNEKITRDAIVLQPQAVLILSLPADKERHL